METMNRRDLLRAGVFCGVVATAGCSGDERSDNEEENDTDESEMQNGTEDTPTETEPTEDTPEDSNLVTVSSEGGTVTAIVESTEETVRQGSDSRAVIQAAIDHVEEGIVSLNSGTYTIVGEPLVAHSGVTLEGAGPSESVLRLGDELHDDAHNVLFADGGSENDSGVVIRDLTIEGNEAANREIDPYPDVPPASGIIVQGEGVTVTNLRVHDTIRSNVVLEGTNSELRELELSNSATDHWIYLADAVSCTIEDVHASGFIRGGGIVFGTSDQTCRDNSVRNVSIENVTAPPHEDTLPSDPLNREFPLMVATFRSDGDVGGNTLSNLAVGPPDGPFNHRIVVAQPDATLSEVTFEGPVGYTHNVVQVGDSRESSDVQGTLIKNVTLDVNDSGDRSNPSVIEILDSGVSVEGIEVQASVERHTGVSVDGRYRSVRDVRLQDITVNTERAALVAEGHENSVLELSVESFVDVAESGVETSGEVSFEVREID